jgi:hypothetical protein
VIKYQAMKVYVGVEIELCAVLTLMLDGREWLASCPTYLTSGMH